VSPFLFLFPEKTSAEGGGERRVKVVGNPHTAALNPQFAILQNAFADLVVTPSSGSRSFRRVELSPQTFRAKAGAGFGRHGTMRQRGTPAGVSRSARHWLMALGAKGVHVLDYRAEMGCVEAARACAAW
jgi:hypothetical protein